jgi:hypothetical protein
VANEVDASVPALPIRSPSDEGFERNHSVHSPCPEGAGGGLYRPAPIIRRAPRPASTARQRRPRPNIHALHAGALQHAGAFGQGGAGGALSRRRTGTGGQRGRCVNT